MLKRLVNALNDLDLKTFSMELLVVILGVFLALQVDNWNEQRKAYAAAELFRARLESDFMHISRSLKALEENFARRIGAGEQLQTVLELPPSDETLVRGKRLVDELLYVGVPVSRSATFIEMLEGSKLDILDDESLIETLIACDAGIQAEQINTRGRADQVRDLALPAIRLALDTRHLPLAEAFEIALTNEVELKRALILLGLADAAGLTDTKFLSECARAVVNKLSEKIPE
ncbi:hypothetical protein R0135_01075 [Congregibacter variabilis]|uniref:Uncharacterized protein n=1 Tax=Congregibacter variabilis TaxID=3081200 RepID=A0ABZ0I2P6_9GAMM|nr:hypothetical protein R0135_01075 [Congregibacter sp. IMCC43200]